MQRQSIRGSISIFLILVMVPLFSCTYLAIDAGRTAAARSRLSAALNLTGNAALNDYDQALKDWYGLFAMGKSKDTMETELAAVFSGMIDAGEVAAGDPSVIEQYINGFFEGLLPNGRGSYDNYINTGTKSFTVSFPADTSLARPDVLERTVTDYMKYRGPYQFARGVKQRIGAFQNVQSAADSLEKAQDYYDSLSGVSKQMERLANKLPVTAEFDEEQEEKTIRTLLDGLDGLSSKVGKSTARAAEWKTSLDSMPDGEAKSLLSGDYKNTAEVLSQNGIDKLKDRLNKDLSTLTAYRQEKKVAEDAAAASEEGTETPVLPDTPSLSYKTDSLYGYIANSKTSETENGEGAAQKSALEAMAKTDRSAMTEGVPDKYVSQVVGSAIASAVDAVGSQTANVLEGSGGSTDTKKLMAQLKMFFKTLTAGEDSLMADCYVEEFLTEQLSCYTTGTDSKNLSGHLLSAGPMYRGEVEYVLFGQEYLPTNVSLAADLIFMVRVLFNSIYVFSNAKMRAEALSVASAVAVWTGVGVAVVQNLILGAWAMAESVCDVSTLTKGGSVPLYKNAATWTLGLSGVTGKLREGASSLASHTIDDVYAKIEKVADDRIEDIRDAALSYFSETTEGAVESLTNMILAPVESKLTTMIGNRTDTTASLSKNDIRSMLMEAVEEADNGSSGFAAAKTAFQTNALEPLTNVVSANYQNLLSAEEEISKTAATAIANGINDAYATLFSEVKKAVNKKVFAAEKTLHASVQEGGKELKADVIDVIDDYSETLSGYLGAGSGTTIGSNTSLSSYSGTAMSYKDYLKIFVFVGIVKNDVKRGMLTRCAKVMQANCRTKESAFRINKTYRSIRLTGSAGIVTHTVKGSEIYAY